MRDKLKGKLQMESNVAVLNAAQKRMMVVASAYLRCGLSKSAAKKAFRKCADELLEMMWESTENEIRRTNYHYAMFDFDGTPSNIRDCYMRLSYEDTLECDEMALRLRDDMQRGFGE